MGLSRKQCEMLLPVSDTDLVSSLSSRFDVFFSTAGGVFNVPRFLAIRRTPCCCWRGLRAPSLRGLEACDLGLLLALS